MRNRQPCFCQGLKWAQCPQQDLLVPIHFDVFDLDSLLFPLLSRLVSAGPNKQVNNFQQLPKDNHINCTQSHQSELPKFFRNNLMPQSSLRRLSTGWMPRNEGILKLKHANEKNIFYQKQGPNHLTKVPQYEFIILRSPLIIYQMIYSLDILVVFPGSFQELDL